MASVFLNRWLSRIYILLGLLLLTAPEVSLATDDPWTGTTSTAWATTTNWNTGAKPGTTDNAVFDRSFTNQPDLAGTNQSIGGIWMKTGVLQNVTISGTGQQITLNANTINGIANMGILLDDTGNYNLTINPDIVLNNPMGFRNNTTGLLTLAGGLATGKKALTLDGTGNITISGVISTANTAGTVTYAGTGVLTLSGANTFISALTIQSGTLSIATINNDSANGVLGNSALAVTLGGSSTTGTLEYTGSTASSTKTFTMATSGTGAFQIDSSGTNLTLSGIIGGSGALSKTGAGTLTLSAANTYTGATTVTGGTLKIDSAGSTTARLASTSGITLNSGGTLLLANSSGTTSNDRINNSATMTLNGGTFNTGGLSEHGASNNTAGIGALTLSATSIIDMGSGSSVIAFADSHLNSWSGTLKIYNWSGTAAYGGGTDQLYVGSTSGGLTSTQLGEITFYSDAGLTVLGAAVILADGEVVPVPEPTTYVQGILLLAVICWKLAASRRRN